MPYVFLCYFAKSDADSNHQPLFEWFNFHLAYWVLHSPVGQVFLIKFVFVFSFVSFLAVFATLYFC